MGQKVSITIVKTDSKIKPDLSTHGSDSGISFGNDKEEDEESEEEEEEEDEEEKKCPCECCHSKCPCCVKLTFCILAGLA